MSLCRFWNNSGTAQSLERLKSSSLATTNIVNSWLLSVVVTFWRKSHFLWFLVTIFYGPDGIRDINNCHKLVGVRNYVLAALKHVAYERSVNLCTIVTNALITIKLISKVHCLCRSTSQIYVASNTLVANKFRTNSWTKKKTIF